MNSSAESREAFEVELALLAASTESLTATLAGLSESDIPAQSLLPGWSRGHVLSHVARNADGILNLITWARTATPTPMYESLESRGADIDAGSGRTLEVIRTDVVSSAGRLSEVLEAVLALDDHELAPLLRRLVQFGAPRPEAPDIAFSLVPLLRRREVEVHHVDLALSYGPNDWPLDFVVTNLSLISARVLARAGNGPSNSAVSSLISTADRTGDLEDSRSADFWPISNGAGPALHGSNPEMLAWLLGRGAGPSLRMSHEAPIPDPPPWS